MNDALFFLGIFAFVFIFWMTGGGSNRPLSLSGPVLQGTSTMFPHSKNTIYTSSFSNTVHTYKKTKVPSNTTSLTGFEMFSPHKEFVTLGHYVSRADATNPDNEYLILRVSSNSKPVNITGWTLKSSTTGVSATIPKGTETPHSGIINSIQSIILKPGDTAIISSGRSPIGASFRENMCIGYFAEFQSFYPPLPLNCPIPYNELQTNYPGGDYMRDLSCIDYIKSLNRCSLVTSPPVNLSTSCDAFLTKNLNYNGCVNIHENDEHFQNKVWRVYLRRDKSMWRTKYEIIKLLDNKGKLVDTFSY